MGVPAHAQRLAAENSDLNADSILAAFLSIPVRLWDLEGRGISRVSAADLASQPVSTVEELLDIFEVIHTSGFISWDENSYAHYLQDRATPRTLRSRVFFVNMISPLTDSRYLKPIPLS